jgi:DNA-binding LytR/AlgR family response regulator
MECIVVDDDPIARKAVEHCIARTESLHLVASCASVTEALKAIKQHKTDLIFLDVEMPEMSGMDFLRTFREIPQIILITAKKEYAAEAFDYDVTDFLLKPVDYARFLKAVNKAQNIQENTQLKDDDDEGLFVKKETSRFVRIGLKEITFVEALADYVNIHTRDGRHTVLATMKSIEARLPQKDFIRIHRSYIVRLDQISEIEENAVNIGGKAIPVSRSHKEDLFNRLKML